MIDNFLSLFGGACFFKPFTIHSYSGTAQPEAGSVRWIDRIPDNRKCRKTIRELNNAGLKRSWGFPGK
jgi:hypothetical protein